LINYSEDMKPMKVLKCWESLSVHQKLLWTCSELWIVYVNEYE